MGFPWFADYGNGTTGTPDAPQSRSCSPPLGGTTTTGPGEAAKYGKTRKPACPALHRLRVTERLASLRSANLYENTTKGRVLVRCPCFGGLARAPHVGLCEKNIIRG